MAGNIARADQLCDLAMQVISASAAVTPIAGTTITVECDDDFDPDTARMPTGQMKVAVSWESYTDEGPVSRSEQAWDIRLVVIAVEVCEVAGKVPTEWRRTRTDWFDQCVVNALGEARQKLDGAYSLRQDLVAFNLDELTERKAFWCAAAITLRDTRKVR